MEQRADPTNDPAAIYTEAVPDESVAANDSYDSGNESAMNSTIDSDENDPSDVYAMNDDTVTGVQDNLTCEADAEQNCYADDPVYDSYDDHADYADNSIFDMEADYNWT